MHEPDNSFKTKSVQVLNVAKMQKSAVLLTSTKAHKGYTTSYSGEKASFKCIFWIDPLCGFYTSPHIFYRWLEMRKGRQELLYQNTPIVISAISTTVTPAQSLTRNYVVAAASLKLEEC